MHLKLQAGENIIVGIRKHWLVFVLEVFGIILGAVLPVIFILPITNFAQRMLVGLTSQQIGAVIMFFLATWLLFLFIIFFIILTNYYLDIVVVTNRRLIDIDQLNLFARDIASTPLENIEDVKIEVLGILATLFGFGNLHVQTAGEARELVIKGIRRPQRAKDIIMEAYEKNKKDPQ